MDSRLLAQLQRKPKLSSVLGKQICLETDDLRVIEISEKCSILTKYVGF